MVMRLLFFAMLVAPVGYSGGRPPGTLSNSKSKISGPVQPAGRPGDASSIALTVPVNFCGAKRWAAKAAVTIAGNPATMPSTVTYPGTNIVIRDTQHAHLITEARCGECCRALYPVASSSLSECTACCNTINSCSDRQ
jgi:hypothetical protein